MTDLILSPASEQLVIDYLKAQADVNALVSGRVSTARPSNPTDPSVTITRFGGLLQEADWIDTPVIQVDIWARTRTEAENVMRTVRAAMSYQAIAGEHTLGIVTSSYETAGPGWLPDPITSLSRYTFDVQLTVHPVKGGNA